jgi:hypothetical protein
LSDIGNGQPSGDAVITYRCGIVQYTMLLPDDPYSTFWQLLHCAERRPSCVRIAAIVASSMPLTEEFKEAGLHSAHRESTDTACPLGSTSKLRDLATSPDKKDCDSITRDPLQDHFINRITQQSLLRSRLPCGCCQISGSRAPRAKKSDFTL